jgi:hypothetical protein
MMHNPIRHNKDTEGSPVDNQPGRIPEPDSFLSNEPVTPAASFEEETRKQLNFLRDRTFNPELRRLVDRIRENEPPLGQAEIPANIDDISEEQLHLQLYRLYYKARNIQDNLEMNISFDPFTEYDTDYPSDISGSISKHFILMMRHISFSHFAILSYDMTAKGYVPKIHELEGFDAANMVISLNDGLFNRILAARDGIIIKPDLLDNDPYMEKIFSMPDYGEGGSLYFIMINNIVDEVSRELSEYEAANLSSFIPSALLMIVLQDGGEPSDPFDIARLLRQRLSLPLYMLDDRRSFVFSLDRLDDLSCTFDILEYFFTLFLLKKDRIGINLRVQKSTGTNMQYMMKYIISKLNNKLFSDSVIINVLKDSLIILTEKPHIQTINGIFEEFNLLFNNSFVVHEFHAADYNDAHDIIQQIIIDN